MHKKPLKCNNCEFESLNPHAMGTHVREEHRLPRTFHSRQMEQTTRNGKFRNFESASSTPRPEASSQTSSTEGRGPTSSSRPETSSNTSSTEDRESPKYHCQGSCSSLQKTFDKQDELELHMEFYHKEQQWLDRAILTFNLEGYKRNQFYLSKLLKSIFHYFYIFKNIGYLFVKLTKS